MGKKGGEGCVKHMKQIRLDLIGQNNALGKDDVIILSYIQVTDLYHQYRQILVNYLH